MCGLLERDESSRARDVEERFLNLSLHRMEGNEEGEIDEQTAVVKGKQGRVARGKLGNWFQHLARRITVGRSRESAEAGDSMAHLTKTRVATLDVFRGFTVALMILVDDAGYYWPTITHAPWNGCTLADFVMPFFLFIVGVAIALAFKRVAVKRVAARRVVLRTLKLGMLGIFLQGGFLHGPDNLSYGVDVKIIRWTGILQRIAFAYLIVALVQIAITDAEGLVLPKGRLGIFKLYKWHWFAAFIILLFYHVVVYSVYVPDWHFVPDNGRGGEVLTVKCGVRAHFGPGCNAAGYIDRIILGEHHLYWHPAWRRSKWCSLNTPNTGPSPPDAPPWCFGPFDPEGIMSSISAILSCIIGIHYGHVLTHFKDHFSRLVHWAVPGVLLLIFGVILHTSNAIPLNKQLYSFSYVCLTSGAAGLVFSLLYIMIDMFKVRYPTLMFEWMGMNALFVFVMGASDVLASFVNGFYYKSPHNNLINWFKKHIFFNVWSSKRVAGLLYVLFGEILFWAIVSGLLHSQGWYWKL